MAEIEIQPPISPRTPPSNRKPEESKDLTSPAVREDEELDPLFGYRNRDLDPDWEVEGTRSAKKRLNLDFGEEKESKKRRKRDGADSESGRSKRKMEKERRAYLVELHAESQRLLRETRDASFKPAPVVQKPISSVLEKLRHRRMMMMKRVGLHYDSESPDIPKESVKDNQKSDKAHEQEFTNDEKSTDDTREVFTESKDKVHEDVDTSLDTPVRSEENMEMDKQIVSSPEKNLPVSPKAESEPAADSPDDTSSDSEDYNKENIDPVTKSVHVDLYKKTGLAKPFIDDEAEEEEDDGDNNLLKFEEKEDEDQSEQSEEQDDIIATAFEEKPIDQERRNELHQKWHEKQDMAETENVLQRLKHTENDRKPSIFQDIDADEELGEDSAGESLGDEVPDNVVRQNVKKAKQMIVQMFDGGDDEYVSSDDEATEERLCRQRLLLQVKDKPSILSPEEDEKSKEFFGLIKKLNIAPDPRKRARTMKPSFVPLVKDASGNSPSKSSFLGWSSSNSLPSSIKKGPVSAKSFVFGRDVSSGPTSVPDNLSVKDKKENQAGRTASAKFTVSQRVVSCKTASSLSTGTEKSLFEILCRSSMQFDQQHKVTNQRNSGIVSETRIAHYLETFKVRNKVLKK